MSWGSSQHHVWVLLGTLQPGWLHPALGLGLRELRIGPSWEPVEV